MAPNRSFQYQLRLWGKIGFDLNSDTKYGRTVSLLVLQHKRTEGTLSREDIPACNKSEDEKQNFSCTCGNFLFSWKELTEHCPPDLPFEMEDTEECPLYISPLEWIEWSKEEGRIKCNSCSKKIGEFSWTSKYECECGTRVSPYFLIFKSEISL